MRTKPTKYERHEEHSHALITRAKGATVTVQLDTAIVDSVKELGDLHVRVDTSGNNYVYCMLIRTDKNGIVRRMPEKLSKLLAGAEDGQTVIHLNADVLDCRVCNLKAVSKGEAILSARTAKNPALGKGATKLNGRFRADASSGAARYYLGTYDSREEALEAIKQAEDILETRPGVWDVRELRKRLI